MSDEDATEKDEQDHNDSEDVMELSANVPGSPSISVKVMIGLSTDFIRKRFPNDELVVVFFSAVIRTDEGYPA